MELSDAGEEPRARTAREEWRAAWPVPMVSMLGNSGTMIFTYSASIFLPVVTAEFGWTRTEFSAGVTFALMLSMVTMPVTGYLVDRIGPRRIALIGLPLLGIAIASLGFQGGSIRQWWLQSVLLALVTALASPVIWCSAIAGRFDRLRGLAFGIALSGSGFAAAIYPLLTTFYVEGLGWRLAYPALALTWLIPALPLAFFFFFAASDVQPAAAHIVRERLPFSAYRPALLSRPFILLLVTGCIFSMAILVIMMNVGPILRQSGMSAPAAAAIAGLAGFSSMAGRLAIGFLIDRYSARRIGMFTFALPLLTCALLLHGGGSTSIAILAALSLGLAMGAELDVLSYLLSRYYGVRQFGGLFGICMAAYGVAAAMGPVLAAWLLDHGGGYHDLLIMMVPIFVASALMIAALPKADHQIKP